MGGIFVDDVCDRLRFIGGGENQLVVLQDGKSTPCRGEPTADLAPEAAYQILTHDPHHLSSFSWARVESRAGDK